MTNREHLQEKRRKKKAAAWKPPKKSEKQQKRESEMAKHLEEKGWVQGRHPDTWKICMYYETNEVYRTLHRAYKMQVKIDSLQSDE